MNAADKTPADGSQPAVAGNIETDDPIIRVRGCNVYYGAVHALKNIDLDIGRREAIALIGASGSGKSAFLRCLNRMNDTGDPVRVEGRIELGGEDIYGPNISVETLRARVGMVFARPVPFPKPIYENVAYGPRIHGLARNRAELDAIVRESLDRTGLWEELRGRLQEPATALTTGQQQCLCIARAIAVQPEALLMDEPCSALDPLATARVENLIDELAEELAVIVVTQSKQHAARVAQRTAYFHEGSLVEVDATDKIFTNPAHHLTEDYLTGRFG